MKHLVRNFIWLLKGIKVYALVGKSGTGKSFRAKLVAKKYGIELIIDDGLLIRNDQILAGRSAKKEKVFLSAIKTALFEETKHRREVSHQLKHEKFKRILIIATSERMARKIAVRLDLPQITKVIKIEDVASKQDIETAMLVRKNEGKHVIPVPAIEVSRDYPQILYDSIKVFLKKRFSLLRGEKYFEKSVVRPEFGNKGRVIISEAALTQMILHCADEYDPSMTVKKVSVKNDTKGYRIQIRIQVPFGMHLGGTMHQFQEYVVDNLERYGGIELEEVNIVIDDMRQR
ncbi:MAG: Asp23/Gls24 family envelope stress response protein [Spirochaetales bacterium]|nr:Asp23/Gls24 family envelope stress response protein [Spirochaetales bacterium]